MYHKMVQLILCIFCPNPEISHFSESLVPPIGEWHSETKIWVLVGLLHWGIIAPKSSQHGELGYLCMYANVHIPVLLYLSAHTHTHAHTPWIPDTSDVSTMILIPLIPNQHKIHSGLSFLIFSIFLWQMNLLLNIYNAFTVPSGLVYTELQNC